MKGMLVIVAVSALCSLAAQEGRRGTPDLQARRIRAQRIEVGGIHLGQVRAGDGLAPGLTIADGQGRRLTLAIDAVGLDARYEDQDPAEDGSARSGISIRSQADGGLVQTFWSRKGGELKLGIGPEGPILRGVWSGGSRIADPLAK